MIRNLLWKLYRTPLPTLLVLLTHPVGAVVASILILMFPWVGVCTTLILFLGGLWPFIKPSGATGNGAGAFGDAALVLLGIGGGVFSLILTGISFLVA